MFWTLELASYLDEAPWPATKEQLLEYAKRNGLPNDVIANLEELEEEDDNMEYESIQDLWPDYPTDEDFFFNEDEY